MEISAYRAAKLSAILLAVTVITQIIYIAISNAGGEPPRMFIWTAEAVAFLGISVFALVVLARQAGHAAVWSAIAVGGILNVVQVGMGLAMFGPLKDAGDAMAPAFASILAGAFFLYFAGKFLFGFAAILIGSGLMRDGGGAAKAVGGLAVVTGIGAMVANLGGMAKGMGYLYLAGGTGTASAFFLALAVWITAKPKA